MTDNVPTTWPEVEEYMRKRYIEKKGVERIGQAYFNALYEIYPEIANRVRGTVADPFYCDNIKDPRMEKFFAAISWFFK